MTKRHVLAAMAVGAVLISSLGFNPAPASAAAPGAPGRLVFVRSTFLGDDFRNDMFTVRPDGRGVRRLTRGREDPFDPRWAPSGRRIVYDGRSPSGDRPGIWVMNANGSDKHRVIGRAGSDADWAPGDRLVYLRAGRLGNDRLYVYSFATGTSRLVDFGDPDLVVFTPTWSPDGQQIAFTAAVPGDEDGAAADLYTVRPDGADLTQVTDTPARWEESPDWSPRGRRLLYGTSSLDSDCTALHTIKPDGTDHRRLRAGCSAMEPVWSPGGGRIAAHRPLARRPGVWVLSRDGSPQRFVVDGYLADWQPRPR